MNTAYTELLDAWVEKSKVHPSEELIEKARLSIARILTEPSELLALWQDTEHLDAWKREVEDLSRRLGSDA
jgi:hypothetical protein